MPTDKATGDAPAAATAQDGTVLAGETLDTGIDVLVMDHEFHLSSFCARWWTFKV